MSTPYPGGPAGDPWPPPGGPPSQPPPEPPTGPPSQWAPTADDPYGAGGPADPYGPGPVDPYGSGGGWPPEPPGPPGSYPPGAPPPEGPPGRRRGGVALALVGALVVLALVAVGAVVALTRSDEPEDFGAGPLSEPEEEWAADLDIETDDEYEDYGGGVTVASDGDVVVVAWNLPYDEDEDESGMEVRAFSADDGEQLWDTQLGSDSYDAPITFIGGGRVLVSEGYDDEATTRLLDSRSGDEIWEADGSPTGELFFGPFGTRASEPPTDRILLSTSSDDGEDSGATMVDLESGDELWSEDDVEALQCGDAVITIDGASSGLEDPDPGDIDITARDGGSGDERWSMEGFPGPCSDGVMGVAVKDDEVVLVDVDSGNRSDPIELEDGSDYTSAAPFGNHVLVTQYAIEEEGSRSAIYSLSGGEPIWEEDDGGYGFPISDDLVVVMDDDGDPTVIRADDGDEVRDIEVPGFEGGCDGVLAARTSLVCEGDDEVTSYSIVGDLGERWSIDLEDDAQVVALGGDRMFVVTADQLVSYR